MPVLFYNGAMSQNQVFINDSNVIEIHVVGDQTASSVEAMGKQAEALLAELADKQLPGLILDDITQMGRTDTPARQTVSHLARSLPFARTAMIGDGGVTMKYGTQLLLQAIGMGSKIKYFEDREAALRWLHQLS